MTLNVGSPVWGFRSADGEDQQSLLAEVFNGNVQGWPFFLFISDGRPPEDEEYETDHELRVSVQGDYGALHWFCTSNQDPPYVTCCTDAPSGGNLTFDGSTGETFPESAALPLSKVQEALNEFLATGKRPECVTWQEFDRV